MSDTEKLLQRIAAMEQALAEAKKPAPPAFDNSDPVGSLTKLGADVPYLTKLLVANAMGDQAPPELRALAHMGPTVAATRALESQLQDLSRQVSSIAESSAKKSARESFRAMTADKTKYPALSKVLDADPTFFDEDLDRHQGSTEEFLSKMEARYKPLAHVEESPPASDADAELKSDSALGLNPGISEQPESAPGEHPGTSTQAPQSPPPRRAAANSRMPSLPQSTSGVFTKEEHDRLRDEIVRKFST